MSVNKPTRSDRRGSFDSDTRLSLLEDDTDHLERLFTQMTQSQGRITSMLWGLMSALLVAVILLALNLAVGGIPIPG